MAFVKAVVRWTLSKRNKLRGAVLGVSTQRIAFSGGDHRTVPVIIPRAATLTHERLGIAEWRARRVPLRACLDPCQWIHAVLFP